jgi:hypothetical protein
MGRRSGTLGWQLRHYLQRPAIESRESRRLGHLDRLHAKHNLNGTLVSIDALLGKRNEIILPWTQVLGP